MKWLIFWWVWMILWSVVAMTVPEWFPQWLQGGIWGAGLVSVFWGIAYAKHVSFMRDQLKAKDDDILRKNEKISELGDELKTLTDKPNSISLGLSRDSKKDNDNAPSLKIQAFELSGKIQAIVLKAKNKPTPKQDAIDNYLKGVGQLRSGNIFANEIPDAEREKENIDREAVFEYLETCYGEAQILRGKVWDALTSDQRIGKKSGNSNPKTIEEVQSIAQSLKTLASRLPD